MVSWHFQRYLSARQMLDSNQVHCFPFLFFFVQPLLCCAVELEGPDATAALNTSVKCKSERNAAAVLPPLIVSGALLSPGPVTFGLHHAVLHTVCYYPWTRQHWKENSNLVLLLCDFFLISLPPIILDPFTSLLFFSKNVSDFKIKCFLSQSKREGEICLTLWTQ